MASRMLKGESTERNRQERFPKEQRRQHGSVDYDLAGWVSLCLCGKVYFGRQHRLLLFVLNWDNNAVRRRDIETKVNVGSALLRILSHSFANAAELKTNYTLLLFAEPLNTDWTKCHENPPNAQLFCP